MDASEPHADTPGIPGTPAVTPVRTRTAVAWNMMAFALTALAGLAMQFIVGGWYGTPALGVFNQAFAVYAIASQIASIGVQFGVVKFVAERSNQGRSAMVAIVSAAVLVGTTGAVTAAVVWSLASPIADALASDSVGPALRWVAPAVLGFSLSKTLLGAVNGLGWMRRLAALRALRAVMLLTSLLGLALGHAPVVMLPLVFTITEWAVALAAVLVLLRSDPAALGWRETGWRKTSKREAVRPWLRRHLSFGLRAMGSGLIVEFNTRVDVLMLGLLMDDRSVGVYSLAAIIMEGMAQAHVVLRTVANPRLTPLLAPGRREGLLKYIRMMRRFSGLGLGALAVGIALAYPLLGWVIGRPEAVMAGWPALAILMLGALIASPWAPTGMILIQAGRPGSHTVLMLGVVTLNLLLNALLIPPLGLIGAAISTATAMIVFTAGLVMLSRRLLGIPI